MPTISKVARVAKSPGFDTALVTEDLDGPWERLTKPLVYRSRHVSEKIVVPQGLVTDNASVPRFPIAYWIAGGKADLPAVVHDFLYRTHPDLAPPFDLDIERKTADLVFYEAMRVKDYSYLFANNNYYWVRAAGWSSWRDHPGELDPR